MGRWVIQSNSLAIYGSSEVCYPDAREVYSLVKGGCATATICGNKVGNPQTELPSLRFSSLGCSLTGKLFTEGSSIRLEILANRRSSYVPAIFQKGHLVDHYVIGATWYFLSEDVELLERCLLEAGIESVGIVTTAQYLKIKRFELLKGIQLFEDSVDIKAVNDDSQNFPDLRMLPLRAKLYPYQEKGFYWLKNTLENVNGCILGDEMGLGKTMQVIATMLYFQEKKTGKSLVIAPISLLDNWKRECQKFAPALSVLIHHGNDRTGNYRTFNDYDVVVSSYSTLVNDLPMMNMVEWNLLVLDEAQNIKNPESERRAACCNLKRRFAIAVSGTPFENHVTDVWSLLDFIVPGLLGAVDEFKALIPDDVDGGIKLEPILSPLMIRRLVKDVANELPSRIDIDRPLVMSENECQRYADLLEKVKNVDLGQFSLGSLQPLRMFCTHPFLLDECINYDENPVYSSAKFQHFDEIIDKIVEQHDKVIVFTSYIKMFQIFSNYLTTQKGVKNWSINGETDVNNRQNIVDLFNNYPHSAVLLLNPRAAGTGLNITGANHVVHYNLEWNPSLEDQASARSYRRGQDKTVFIYRLYYRDSVEQIIQDRILKKRAIAESAVVGITGCDDEKSDIAAAFNLVPQK